MAERTPEERFERSIAPLDYSANSGSMGNSHYSDGPSEGDSRPLTDTTFRVSESPNDSRNWKHMKDIQEGKYADDNNTKTRHVEQKRDLKTFASQIDLPSWERKYALCLLDYIHNIDTDHEGGFCGSADALILAIITFAANKNERRIRGENKYETIREDCNISKDQIRGVRQKIREEMS
jgi:hypothetical protein